MAFSGRLNAPAAPFEERRKFAVPVRLTPIGQNSLGGA
jgi:hypothetical protein